MKNNIIFRQFLRFCIVGIANTLLTAAVIFLLLKVAKISDIAANLAGYVVGLLNSFVWNRRWTFSSNLKITRTFFKFLLIFVVSYIVQFVVVILLIHSLSIDNYYSHLLAMIPYTIANFLLNKFYTFKSKT
ncbi:MAG: GtrA family protein [Prevotellaceae bacterium]|jgi:putative flippase GtrA|nr:GtrA family protein [Prevotellaceae bacterium]